MSNLYLSSFHSSNETIITSQFPSDFIIQGAQLYEKVLFKGKQLALQKEKPDLIRLVFDIIFGGRIVFEDLLCQTGEEDWFFPFLSQQKNPSEEEFSQNPLWQQVVENIRNEIMAY